MSIAFIPVYLHILGIEIYGLIGFFLSVQAFFSIFDLGLSATLNRELARHTHTGRISNADAIRDLVRTLEWVYWSLGFLIAASIFAASSTIATHWLKPVLLSSKQTAQAIGLMGLAAALQWPSGFYAGGFRGLERQIILNGLNATFATLRSAGAAGVLFYCSPTLEAFLLWQVTVNGLQTVATGTGLWRLLPKGSRTPTFRRECLKGIRGFALGMTGIIILSFVLVQADRIILSTLLPLNEFGYYTLAITVTAVLSSVVQPFFAALFPRYTSLVAAGDQKKLIALYHESNQLLAVGVATVAAVVGMFAEEIVLLWTHDAVIATRSALLLTLLLVGTALNGLMNLPYALQLAYGWTRLALYQNIVAVLVVVPAIYWLGQRYGGPGAAVVCIALNLGYVTLGIPLMHRKLLPNEMWSWYRHDILPPLIAASATAGAARLVVPIIPEGLTGIVVLSGIGLATFCMACLWSPVARVLIRQYLGTRLSSKPL